ncbi:MAG: toxin-antitoxin system, antitoxin component [Deltaproteobacteria bacterium]|nr:toxin-antitoxin system, antitoxin component [Deltaproteobacteria bacterium]MBW2218811.1 toxin-antitoxin system, antitoxin component [Deltaproteobacteria bacterium]
MAQLSIYIDENTLKKIEVAAELENISISKFVTKKINKTIEGSWPDNFDSLFGSIRDETFNIIGPVSYKNDVPREKL